MARRANWKRLVRVGVAFAVGLAIWLGLIGLYRSWVMAPTEFFLRLAENPDVTSLRADAEPGMIIVDRADFPPESPRPVIRLGEITFNLVLLFALFGLSPLSDRNMAGLAISLGILWLTHIAAMIVHVKKIYAHQLGAWSQIHYGPVSRNVWGLLDQFYSVVGIFAVAFLLWWSLGRQSEKDRLA